MTVAQWYDRDVGGAALRLYIHVLPYAKWHEDRHPEAGMDITTMRCSLRLTPIRMWRLSTTPHLGQGESFSLAVDDHFTGRVLYLLLDEPQQVLLVHTRRGMDVGVHL